MIIIENIKKWEGNEIKILKGDKITHEIILNGISLRGVKNYVINVSFDGSSKTEEVVITFSKIKKLEIIKEKLES